MQSVSANPAHWLRFDLHGFSTRIYMMQSRSHWGQALLHIRLFGLDTEQVYANFTQTLKYTIFSLPANSHPAGSPSKVKPQHQDLFANAVWCKSGRNNHYACLPSLRVGHTNRYLDIYQPNLLHRSAKITSFHSQKLQLGNAKIFL